MDSITLQNFIKYSFCVLLLISFQISWLRASDLPKCKIFPLQLNQCVVLNGDDQCRNTSAFLHIFTHSQSHSSKSMQSKSHLSNISLFHKEIQTRMHSNIQRSEMNNQLEATLNLNNHSFFSQVIPLSFTHLYNCYIKPWSAVP